MIDVKSLTQSLTPRRQLVKDCSVEIGPLLRRMRKGKPEGWPWGLVWGLPALPPVGRSLQRGEEDLSRGVLSTPTHLKPPAGQATGFVQYSRLDDRDKLGFTSKLSQTQKA